MTRAWWIDPQGELLEVTTSHIDAILQQPARFGLTRTLIEEVYAAHGEPVGFEGKAREILLRDAIGRGWIRIREYEQHWKVNAPLPDARLAERLQAWAESAAPDDGPDRVAIETPVGTRELPLQSLRRGKGRRRKGNGR